jgi:hypothetical protein
MVLARKVGSKCVAKIVREFLMMPSAALAMPGPNNDLCIFDPDSGASFELDMARKVCSLAFSPNCETLAVGCERGFISFIDEKRELMKCASTWEKASVISFRCSITVAATAWQLCWPTQIKPGARYT